MKPLRVIFLDIDGVLNSHRYFESVRELLMKGYNDDSRADQYAVGMLDPDALRLLNRIVKETGAVVVISSSWRHGHMLPQVGLMLRYRGFEGTVIGCTPDVPRELGEDISRGKEIQAWLDAVPSVESFVILDDDADAAHLAEKLVKTTYEHGLLPEHAERAIEILLKGVA